MKYLLCWIFIPFGILFHCAKIGFKTGVQLGEEWMPEWVKGEK